MNETIEWLRDRPYYREQINAHEVMDGRRGTHASLDMDSYLDRALDRRGIENLYEHQTQAIEEIRTGQNIVIATPTASGKSLAYTVPAFERAIGGGGRTLYIAPLRALINDQEESLADLAADLGPTARVGVGQYTGQLSKREKRAVRDEQPHIVLMTPDLLHYGVLPNDYLWEWFFRQLETVVIDEVHEYRGIFGSHIALLMRRLSRMCERYDSDPQFICCSATIGNPAEHAGNVTGQPPESFSVIEQDTSRTGRTHWLFWNPPRKADDETNEDANLRSDTTHDLGSGSEQDVAVTVHDPDGADQQPSSPEEIVDTDEPTAASDGGTQSDRILALRKGILSPTTPGTNQSGTDDGSNRSTPLDSGGERASSHAETVSLFCDLVERGYQTLVFTRTRQGAERCANWAAKMLHGRNQHDLAAEITAYQASLKQERREEIEDGLHDGSISGVWSTSALELGVDVGGLDVVLLDGYPGTRMEAHQRAGRAGRGRDASLVTLVGGRDQLDQYLMGHPEAFFDGDPETAAVNATNEQLMPDHVLSAARESWLSPADKDRFGETFPGLVAELESEGLLEHRDTKQGLRWTYSGGKSPQHEMDLRQIDDREVVVRDRLSGDTLGTLSYEEALRDVHQGAIYYHQGTKYEVVELDLRRNVALLESTNADYYTQALSSKSVTINEVLAETTLDTHPKVGLRFADINFREEVTGYRRCAQNSDTGVLMELDQPLPPTKLRTRALYFTIPPAAVEAIKAESEADDGFEGAIHAIEHAMISLFPLEFLCDRRDIGGVSVPLHEQTGASTIFIYDGYPGGVGLARGGYERVEELLEQTRKLLANCSCESGCPACVQSPHCGNANDPLSKPLALSLLERLLSNDRSQ